MKPPPGSLPCACYRRSGPPSPWPRHSFILVELPPLNRQAQPMLLQILYYLFPQIDWGFVFVDDFCWLLRLPTGPQFTAALLGTLVALGTPLSWKKTYLAEINTWLGFVVHPSIPRVQMAAPKHIKVMEPLEELANGSPMSAKAIEKAMGRIQWATACCPLTKSLLQPMWAWKMAVKTMGHPRKVVRMLAALLRELFTHPFEQYSPFLPKSPWWGCSDASASKTGEAYVLWFHYAITADAHPWAFKDGNPQKRIAALELLGTLLLCKHLVAQQAKCRGEFASRWAVTTQATSSACSTSRPRNHTLRHCSWNWFSSFIVRAVASLPITSPGNSTPGG